MSPFSEAGTRLSRPEDANPNQYGSLGANVCTNVLPKLSQTGFFFSSLNSSFVAYES